MRLLSSLAQEIIHKGHKVTEETFSFLLMGCIQDKKAGFLKAVQVSLALALPGARVSFVFKLYVCMYAGGQKRINWSWSCIACCESLELDAGNHTQVL